jgi:hypothetical protein
MSAEFAKDIPSKGKRGWDGLSSRVEFMDDSSLMGNGPNTERHTYYKSSIVSTLIGY